MKEHYAGSRLCLKPMSTAKYEDSKLEGIYSGFTVYQLIIQTYLAQLAKACPQLLWDMAEPRF